MYKMEDIVMEKIESFYEEYEDMFEEYLENARENLKKSNEEYVKLRNEYNKILDENENLTWILETQPEFPYSPNPYLLIDRTYKNYNYIREKHYQNKGSILYLIFYYEKLFGINTENVSKSNMTRMTPELIKEIKQMDEYSNQAIILANHKINTEEQLNEFEKEAYKKLAPLKSERENLWKKHKKARTDDDRKLIEKQIAEISKRITPLAEKIRHCKNIQKRMEKIKKFELHQQLENEKKEFEKEQIKKKQDRF